VRRINYAGCDLNIFPRCHPEPCPRNFIAGPLAQPAIRVMNYAHRKLTSHIRIAHRPVRYGMLINRHPICEGQVGSFLPMADVVGPFPSTRQHVDGNFILEPGRNGRRDGKEEKHRCDQEKARKPLHARAPPGGMSDRSYATVTLVKVRLQTPRQHEVHINPTLNS